MIYYGLCEWPDSLRASSYWPRCYGVNCLMGEITLIIHILYYRKRGIDQLYRRIEVLTNYIADWRIISLPNDIIMCYGKIMKVF